MGRIQQARISFQQYYKLCEYLKMIATEDNKINLRTGKLAEKATHDLGFVISSSTIRSACTDLEIVIQRNKSSLDHMALETKVELLEGHIETIANELGIVL